MNEPTVKIPLEKSEELEETEVGNYFVANYPPFSFWKPEYKSVIEEVLDRPAPEDVPLGVYFHIPFCRKRCHFCYFRVYTDKNASEIRAYIDAGIREYEITAKRAYLQGRKPKFIYFGGGTPSYLNIDQLQDLTDRMKAIMPWDEAEEVAFECEPGTLTEKKLEKIREIGVTRLSLGVENFDDHILEINGRAHRGKEIERSYHQAKALGFPQINIDLIAGMMDETEDNWKRVVEKAISLDPECVTIYQMEVPFNTTIYKEMKETGKLTAPVANWQTKRRWVDYAFAEFEKAGYGVSSAYTVVKNPDKFKFVYRDALWEGADLLPLGVASFGMLADVHYQNQADVGPYMQAIDSGESPVFRAYATNAEERLVREFILRLKLGSIRPSYYQERFGVDVLERFAKPLAFLQSEGFISLEEDAVVLSREGLLQVDRLLHEFFLPEHRNARYT
ncbi:MAG: oxygen-independent coproporphyrinogen-3 oxidase [Verrucomicrobiales bacterium]|jgi:oxygen-independent coproporphyrinogen-3 oxidase